MKSILSLLVLILAVTTTASAHVRIASDHPQLVYVGRVSHKTPGCARYSYPGIQIHAMFSGTSVSMIMKPGSGFYMIELDDRTPFKVKSSATDSVVNVANNLPEGNHRLTITLCNEGKNIDPAFYGLMLDDGASLFDIPSLPQRKMEFIGNSITCALGIEDFSKAKKTGNDSTQNAYFSFAHQTARLLNAQCVLVACSGKGVYRNVNGPKKGSRDNMQACYPNTFCTFKPDAERWDFSRYTPDVVCINLGTNDTTYPAYDTTLLTQAFIKFVHTIRGNYPNATIVLLSGTMRKGKLLSDLLSSLNHAVEILKQEGETNLYRLDFTPADGSLGYGAFMHPSLKQHTQMANELAPFIRKIMKWE